MLLGEKSTSSGQQVAAILWPFETLDLGVETANATGRLWRSVLTVAGKRSRDGACHKKMHHEGQEHINMDTQIKGQVDANSITTLHYYTKKRNWHSSDAINSKLRHSF
jgi:hypothetical protein